MTAQQELELDPLIEPDYRRGASLQEQFIAFHEANPGVLTALEHLTRKWLDAGHDRVSVNMLFELLRWEYGIDTRGDRLFRLNNNHRSRYVRLIRDRHPEWAGVFAIRELKTA